MLAFHATPTAKRRGKTKDNRAVAEPISDKHVGIYKDLLSGRDQRILAWVAGESLEDYGYGNILEPLDPGAEQLAYMDEMDGRIEPRRWTDRAVGSSWRATMTG